MAHLTSLQNFAYSQEDLNLDENQHTLICKEIELCPYEMGPSSREFQVHESDI